MKLNIKKKSKKGGIRLPFRKKGERTVSKEELYRREKLNSKILSLFNERVSNCNVLKKGGVDYKVTIKKLINLLDKAKDYDLSRYKKILDEIDNLIGDIDDEEFRIAQKVGNLCSNFKVEKLGKSPIQKEIYNFLNPFEEKRNKIQSNTKFQQPVYQPYQSSYYQYVQPKYTSSFTPNLNSTYLSPQNTSYSLPSQPRASVNLQSQRIPVIAGNPLVILDIDQTILKHIHTNATRNFYNKNQNIRNFYLSQYPIFHDIDENDMFVFQRDFIPFMRYLLDNEINVAIYTYGNSRYAERVRSIIQYIMNLNSNPFVFVWSRDRKGGGLLIGGRNEFHKNLEQVWEHPRYKDKFNKSNTILIDDKLENTGHSKNSNNSILIEKFNPFGSNDIDFNKQTTSNSLRIIHDLLKDAFDKDIDLTATNKNLPIFDNEILREKMPSLYKIKFENVRDSNDNVEVLTAGTIADNHSFDYQNFKKSNNNIYHKSRKTSFSFQ